MKAPKPRKEIDNFSPYTAGMSIEEVKEKYGLKKIVKLASNENLFGVSKKAVKKIKKELKNISMYPQPRNTVLIKKLAEKFDLNEGNIITGSGADELIELIAKTFLSKEDNIVVSQNSFIRYKMAAKLMGAKVKEIKQDNYRHSPNGIIEAVDENTKVIFIDNPCNPTGTYLKKDELQLLVDKVTKLEVPPLLVVDEAYYEFTDADDFISAVKFVNNDMPVMVLRTFSKIAGLAGLRIGYGISSKEIISFIERIRPPFNTNRLAQAGAIGALEDVDFISNTKEEIIKEKEFLYESLAGNGIKYIESETNFILVDLNDREIDISKFCEYCLKNGLILRPLNGYKLPGHIRVTVGKRKDNKKFIDLLLKYLKEKEVKL